MRLDPVAALGIVLQLLIHGSGRAVRPVFDFHQPHILLFKTDAYGANFQLFRSGAVSDGLQAVAAEGTVDAVAVPPGGPVNV